MNKTIIKTILAVALGLTACAHDSSKSAKVGGPTMDYSAVVAETDRSEEDRAMDAGRQPVQALTFCAVAPGMHVEELGAGRGYMTELLARSVGPNGVVYAENPEPFQKFVGEQFSARLAHPAMSKVVKVDQPLEAPFPADAHNLDVVLSNLVYHDFVWMNVDRAAMNKAIFDALKPGGHYVVIDHSAADGHGANDVKTLHRIDEKLVRSEIEAAGFKLEGEGDFLRSPADTRDWSASPHDAGEKRGTSDRFALRFVKPAA